MRGRRREKHFHFHSHFHTVIIFISELWWRDNDNVLGKSSYYSCFRPFFHHPKRFFLTPKLNFFVSFYFPYFIVDDEHNVHYVIWVKVLWISQKTFHVFFLTFPLFFLFFHITKLARGHLKIRDGTFKEIFFHFSSQFEINFYFFLIISA